VSPITLDFDGVEDRGDFSPLPSGTYDCTIFSIDASKVGRDSKQPYAEFVYKVQEGEYKGRQLWQNFSFQKQALWGLKRLLVKLGYDPEKLSGKFEFEPRELLGRRVFVTVSESTYNGKPSNDVTDVDVPGPDGQAPSGATASSSSTRW